MIPIVIFYLLAVLPFIFGGIMWIFNKKIHWGEWLIASAVAFIMCGAFHGLALIGLTDDVETWSGQITQVRQYSAWKEYYEEAIYKTEYYTDTEYYRDSDGKSRTRSVTKSRRVFSHWESRRRWHKEHWEATSNIQTSYDISFDKYKYIAEKFGGIHPVEGRRTTFEHNSRMIDGDRNDYVADNNTRWIEPVTKLVAFENRIKAAPSSFSFSSVPKDVKGLFEYPKNSDPFSSDRLLGSAALINLLKFDQMNARLGPKKRVNVIMVGMGNVDSMAGEWQRSKWIGGKKNDIVIAWGGLNTKPTWVKCFGWSDSEICKRNLESIILDNGVSNDTLPLIEEEIYKNYTKKNWKDFEHISIPIPYHIFLWYVGAMIIVQTGLWIFYHYNNIDKAYGNYR